MIEEQTIFVKQVGELIAFCYAQGFYLTFSETYRTPEQAAIYAKENKGIKNSLHCQRLAIDLNLFIRNTLDGKLVYQATVAPYKFLGDFWKHLDSHNRWGGDFSSRDANHFERCNESRS